MTPKWRHTFQKVGVILTPIIYSLMSSLKRSKMVQPAIDDMLRELIINKNVDCSPGALRPHISLAKNHFQAQDGTEEKYGKFRILSTLVL